MQPSPPRKSLYCLLTDATQLTNTQAPMKRPITTLITVCGLALALIGNCGAQVKIARGRVAIPLAVKVDELANRELYFLKKVCNPNPSEYKAIVEATEKRTKEMQEMYLELSKNKDPSVWPRPQQLVTDHLQKLADKAFTPQVAMVYRSEITARNEANINATASIVTNLIDSQVLLSPSEMDSLTTKVAQLDTTKKATLPVAFFYRHMIPIPSTEKLDGLLSERQLALWKTQKRPSYNQPWVNYFNSNDFLSNIFPPGIKQPDPGKRNEGDN
ncbi:MAG: hypothetical protein CMM07_01300 [Rhodopirellula sp.]|nr:hypothetical protein [Rhodopirellula sp.]